MRCWTSEDDILGVQSVVCICGDASCVGLVEMTRGIGSVDTTRHLLTLWI